MTEPFLRRNLLAACLLGTLFAGALLNPDARAVGAGACATTSISVDTSRANTSVACFHGRGHGETFMAQDTLLRAISVWETAISPVADTSPRHLFIMAVDSTGRPIRTPLLLVGPTLVPTGFDGVHPLKDEFILDPPFALPKRGRYFFTIQAECLSAFFLLADTANSYADGKVWKTGPVSECSVPGSAVTVEPPLDLIFEVQFCDTTTAARRRTWGEVKTLYR